MPIPKQLADAIRAARPAPRFIDQPASAIASRLSRISVPFAAVGKPRMTQRDRWSKRTHVVAYRAWCDELRLAVQQQIGSPPPADQVIALDWLATFAPPPSWSKRRKLACVGQLHRETPDRDNIDKAILDCLWPKTKGEQGDEAIASGRLRKVWGFHPSLVIEIWWNPRV